jgi:hypothetical protein
VKRRFSMASYYERHILGALADGRRVDPDDVARYLTAAAKERRPVARPEVMRAIRDLVKPAKRKRGYPKGGVPLNAVQLAVVDLFEYLKELKRGEFAAGPDEGDLGERIKHEPAWAVTRAELPQGHPYKHIERRRLENWARRARQQRHGRRSHPKSGSVSEA